MSQIRWHRFVDADALARDAARQILQLAARAIGQRGCFRIVLAGGTTPVEIYRLLLQSGSDWNRWEVYLGDERCLPADDPQRNSVAISAAWIGQCDIPAEQVHWIPAELGNERAAKLYSVIVAAALPFDLVLLGMGEDGHTASLFPGQEHPADRPVVPVFNAPKPPPERVSLNYATLSSARHLMVLVTGAGKRDAVARWRAGEALPVAGVECGAGVDVWLDHAASDTG